MSVLLEEQVCIERNDTRLVGLGNIGKDAVDHPDEHAVLVRVAGVFDDGDDVCALLGHINQIATRAVRKLDSVHEARLN